MGNINDIFGGASNSGEGAVSTASSSAPDINNIFGAASAPSSASTSGVPDINNIFGGTESPSQIQASKVATLKSQLATQEANTNSAYNSSMSPGGLFKSTAVGVGETLASPFVDAWQGLQAGWNGTPTTNTQSTPSTPSTTATSTQPTPNIQRIPFSVSPDGESISATGGSNPTQATPPVSFLTKIENIPSKVINAGWNAITGTLNDFANKATQATYTLGGLTGKVNPDGTMQVDTSVTPGKRAAALTSAALSGANIPFLPATATLKAAEQVPGLNYVAKGINAVFGGIYAGTSQPAIAAFNSLPISQSEKDRWSPLVGQAAGLAGSIYFGGKTMEGIGKAKDFVGQVTSPKAADVNTLAAHVKTLANVIKNGLQKSAPEAVSNDTTTTPPPTETPISNPTGSNLQTIPESTPTPRITGADIQRIIAEENQPKTSTPEQTTTPTPTTEPVGGSELQKIAPPETTPSQSPTSNVQTIPVRTAKSASDISQTAAEQGFATLSEEEQAKYSPTTKAEQIQKVADIMKNIPLAKDMINGKKPVPSDVKGQVLWNAMEKYATDNKDGQLLIDLSKSHLASERSVHAQELGAAGFNENEHSPAAAIREITQMRKEEYTRKYKETPEKAVKAKTAKAVKDTERAVKTMGSKRPTWEQFVKDIVCK